MNLKIKSLSRSGWRRVTDRTYRYQMMDDQDFHGAAGLIHIKAVRSPLIKRMDDTDVKIVDNGYYWLELAPRDQHYCLTVMINEKEEPVQYYFDITYENHMEIDGESYFDDLYLDVVMLPDGRMFLLDEDELAQALKDHIIDQATYDMARITANNLMDTIRGRKDALWEYCRRYFYLLKNQKRVTCLPCHPRPCPPLSLLKRFLK